MEKVRRVFAVPSQGYAYTSRVDDKTVAENEARRVEALSLLTKAAHMLGYHPDEMDVARQSLPTSLRDLEMGGWLPSHVAVHLLRRIEGLAGMAALADVLERCPDIREDLEERSRRHSKDMQEIARASQREFRRPTAKRQDGAA